ncbi:MAG: PIN domain-containing protein [Patescibacteria group bacterium]
MKVFVDSDVVISSLISSMGAAFKLMNSEYEVVKIISNISLKELKIVTTRLSIKKPLPHFSIQRIKNIEKYSIYSTDPNDAHIIAGAHKSEARFLITYNMKHYKVELIKRNLDIIVITPGAFLQYLRSIV